MPATFRDVPVANALSWLILGVLLALYTGYRTKSLTAAIAVLLVMVGIAGLAVLLPPVGPDCANEFTPKDVC